MLCHALTELEACRKEDAAGLDGACAMVRRPSSVTTPALPHIDVPLPCRNVKKWLGMAGGCLPSARGAAAKRLGRSRGDLLAADDTFTWWLGWRLKAVGLMTERQAFR